MAWLFGDGFDHYDSATLQAGAKWQVSGTPQILANGRRGGGALDLDSVSEGVIRGLGVTIEAVISGVALQVNSNGSNNPAILFALRNSVGIQAGLSLSTVTNTLQVFRASTATVIYDTGVSLAAGSFNYIEFKCAIHPSAGTAEVRVNGSVAGTPQTGLNTRGQSDNNVTSFQLGHYSFQPASFDLTVDDLYICDTTGSENNDFLGDIRCDLLLPDGAGNYQQWTPSTGTDHHAVIDENPPNTSDYLSNGTNGEQDSSTLTAPGTTLVGVKCVQVNNYVLKDDAGLALVQNLIRSNSVDETGPTFGVSTSPLYSISKHETDPDTSAAWTNSAILALEAGIKNVTA